MAYIYQVQIRPCVSPLLSTIHRNISKPNQKNKSIGLNEENNIKYKKNIQWLLLVTWLAF